MVTTPDRRRYQYSLRTLLELTAVVCLGGSLWAWGGEAISRTPEFFLGLAIMFIAVGVYLRRWTMIFGGAIIVGGLLLALRINTDRTTFESEHTWRQEQLFFKVVDAQTNSPIPNAVLVITSGKPSARTTIQGCTSPDGTVALKVMKNIAVLYDYLAPEDADRDIKISISAQGYQKTQGTELDYRRDSNGFITIELLR